MNRSFVPALALAFLVVAASPAAAADVSVVTAVSGVAHQDDDGISSEVHVTAAPGERNDVRVTSAGAVVLVRDAGAPLRAGDGCRAEGDAVRCARAGDGAFDGVHVALGDGDDRFAGDPARSAPRERVEGEDGADELRAGAAGATLDGGAGDDLVAGGPEDDVLDAGDGADTLLGGAGGDLLTGDGDEIAPDRIDGGPERRGLSPGGDTVRYSNRMAAVRVDLGDPAPDGAVGEGDVLTGIESVDGSPLADDLRAGAADSTLDGDGGDDRLTGAGGADVLGGAEGDDVLAGRGGDDELTGGGGRDTLAGGVGDDLVWGDVLDPPLRAGPGDDVVRRSGRAPAVVCGAGRDVFDDPSNGMLLPAGCEAVATFGTEVGRPRVTRSALVFRVRLHGDARRARVRVAITVRSARGATLGTRERVVHSGERLRLVIALSTRVRRRLRHGAPLRVTLATSPDLVPLRYRVAPVRGG